MLISKLNLYDTEWLDVVFNDRNKAYGAYALRYSYNSTLTRAMGITFSGIAVLTILGIALHKTPPPEASVKIVTFNTIHPVLPQPIKKVEPRQPASLPSTPHRTISFLKPVITSQPVNVAPPKMDDLAKAEIGPVTVNLPGDGHSPTNVLDGGTTGTAQAPAPPALIDAGDGTLDVMPEPFGGASTWGKFLQKNLRYPSQASEAGVQGKVWLSFVIETDGRISNIVVERPAGHGFDEEAQRVLKMAPAWKPGKQHGQPVRVKYTLPISFTMTDNN